MTAVARALSRLQALQPALQQGEVVKVTPSAVVASGPLASVGDVCRIEAALNSSGPAGRSASGEAPPVSHAEVAAVDASTVTLIPLDRARQVRPGDRVTLLSRWSRAPVGDGFAGRLVDSMGSPLDGGDEIVPAELRDTAGQVLAPLARADPHELAATGLTVIDALMPLAKGQRVGVLAASGVGKTTLLRQLAFGMEADHCILCLVGERGREVEQLWQDVAAHPRRKRFTLVAATSDTSPGKRVRSVWQALCLAEYWRDQGRHVVLVVDSVTRFALALREIGLLAGEPPTTRAYTPSVFATLPVLVERSGAAQAGGAITAIMSVLCETDDADDPIAETMKSLLDGHLVLSRELAAQGHFPAIDPLRSISRQSERLLDPDELAAARTALKQLALWDSSRVMVESGIYRPGTNAELDAAMAARPQIMGLLAQELDAWCDPQHARRQLRDIMSRRAS